VIRKPLRARPEAASAHRETLDAFPSSSGEAPIEMAVTPIRMAKAPLEKGALPSGWEKEPSARDERRLS
jgi:hypothetical protein